MISPGRLASLLISSALLASHPVLGSAVAVCPAGDGASLSNLRDAGADLVEAGDLAAAAACFEQVLRLTDGGATRLGRDGLVEAQVLHHQHQLSDDYLNLGLTQYGLGLMKPALASLESAVVHNEDNEAAHQVIGSLLLGLSEHRRRDLVERLKIAVAAKPGDAVLLSRLGAAHGDLGELDAAASYYRQALGIDPAQAFGRYHYDLILQQQRHEQQDSEALLRAPPAYIQELFDSGADHFDDELLGPLRYRGPGLLQHALLAAFNNTRPAERPPAAGPPTWHVVDLGVGTGLVGQVVRPWARRLVGVDLSPRMVEQARGKTRQPGKSALYDELVLAEASDYLGARERRAAVDLIVAADLMVYLGCLDAVLGAASHAVRSAGFLGFSTEQLARQPRAESHAHDDAAGGSRNNINGKTGWRRLASSGRFAHDHQYVQSVARKHGFDLVIKTTGVGRYEGGHPVNMDFHVFRRR